jgi:hypothetical protein
MKAGEVYLMRIRGNQVKLLKILEINNEIATVEYSCTFNWSVHKRVRLSKWMYRKLIWGNCKIGISDLVNELWKKIQ